MVRHIVMWKMKPSALGLEKKALQQEVKARLESLPAKISEIHFFQVGLNITQSDIARDIVLVSDFEDGAALKRYAVHPAHLEVAAYIQQVVEERRVVDFEVL